MFNIMIMSLITLLPMTMHHPLQNYHHLLEEVISVFGTWLWIPSSLTEYITA